jgi:hypothetical protein
MEFAQAIVLKDYEAANSGLSALNFMIACTLG